MTVLHHPMVRIDRKWCTRAVQTIQHNKVLTADPRLIWSIATVPNPITRDGKRNTRSIQTRKLVFFARVSCFKRKQLTDYFLRNVLLLRMACNKELSIHRGHKRPIAISTISVRCGLVNCIKDHLYLPQLASSDPSAHSSNPLHKWATGRHFPSGHSYSDDRQAQLLSSDLSTHAKSPSHRKADFTQSPLWHWNSSALQVCPGNQLYEKYIIRSPFT